MLVRFSFSINIPKVFGHNTSVHLKKLANSLLSKPYFIVLHTHLNTL